MGKLLEFVIVVEGLNPQANGNHVNGQVIVNLKEPMKMRNLRLELNGQAYCHWTEQHGSGDNRRTVSYTGREQLVNMVSYLFNPPTEGKDSSVHPSGRFSYPFVFVMPNNLPSSIEAAHGHIKYGLKATIDKPWKFDHKVEQPLIISEQIDTNHPNFLVTPGGSVSKEIGCCCPSGILGLDGHINRSAFCPGESIIMNVQANNQSRTDMQGLKAKLVKTIEYHATSKTRREFHTISTFNGPPISRGETGCFTNQPLNVPQTSTSITSKVIKCHYHVIVEVDVPCGFDLDLTLPITIGNIPFRGDYGVNNQNSNWVAAPPTMETPFQNAPSAPPQSWQADQPPPYAPPLGPPPPGLPPVEAPPLGTTNFGAPAVGPSPMTWQQIEGSRQEKPM